MNTLHSRNGFFSAMEPKRSHLLLMVAFFFLIGCATVEFTAPGMWLWGLAAVGAGLIWLAKAGKRRMEIGIAVLCFALGAAHAHQAMDAAMPEAGKYEITGYVYGAARERDDDRITFVLGDLVLDNQPVKGKAYCSLRYAETLPQLFDGAKLRFEGYVYHPDGKNGEPRMDFRLWMRQQGYRFGVTIYQELTVENEAVSAPVKDAAHRVREMFSSAFERSMGENGRIAMALLFGDRGGLTDEEYAAFQDLGIAHIMSVSGLHVGLVGGLLMLALDRFSLRKRAKLLILGFFLLDYCALTGFSAASVRAAVMLICALLGRLLLRRGDSLTTLATAMLVVLLIDPLSALSAGFVLSFSAMLGIMLYTRPVLEGLDRLWKPIKQKEKPKQAEWQRKIKTLIAVSLTAQLGVLMPTVRYFQQLPLYGMVINLLIVPLVGSVLVPLYAVTLLCSLFPLIGTIAGGAASLATDGMLWMVELLSRLPYAAIRTAAPPALVCVGLGAAAVMLSRRFPGSLRTRLTAALLTVLVSAGVWIARQPDELRYIQLAVGQADSALLLDGDQTIVIDVGSDASAAIDYLRCENRDVDALILTHLHMDHAGGAAALLESGIPVRRIYLPENAPNQQLDEDAMNIYQQLLSSDIPLATLASGDELRYNKSIIRVLWPERETVRSGHDANDYSLALSINLDGYTMLHAGDLTGSYERYAAVPADVLKVAHHGSDDSTDEDFLAFVHPSWALLSVSGGSRSLPGEQTLERLQTHGVEIFRTDECGDLTLSVQDGRLTITPYKERNLP